MKSRAEQNIRNSGNELKLTRNYPNRFFKISDGLYMFGTEESESNRNQTERILEIPKK